MKNILFLLSLSSLALVSCEDFFSQTVEIDPPPYEKQLVFHVNVTDADSSIRLTLSRNFGILETVPKYSDFFVGGGTAELYKDGQKWLTLTPLNQDSTFVLTGTLPEAFQSGSNYEIRAEHPAFPKVTATQVMPGDFTVDSARIKHNSSTNQFGDKLDLVEVYLQDPPGVRNYYEVVILNRYYSVEYDPNTGIFDTLWYNDYPIYAEDYPDPNVVSGTEAGGLVSDQFFDGQAYKFQARIYSGSSGEQLTVRVRNVTEDYYKWSRSYELKSNDDENPLVEPVSVFDNLTNGLGIFSLAREKVFLVK